MNRIGVILRIVVIVWFVLLLGVGCASSATFVVNQTSPACTTGDFYCDAIQEAVDMANDGDTIVVCDGIYREHVVIDKPLILKASGNVTIGALDAGDFIVRIKANNVVFSGFNVKGGYVGISLNNVQGCRIENNSVFENEFGIGLLSSSNGNSIVNNVVFKNKINGIHLQDSSNNNSIINNTAYENVETGIYLQNSSGNEVCNNIVNKNLEGIGLLRSNNNEIKNSTACENGDRGIVLQDSSRNDVSNNIANKNECGIGLIRSNNNTIKNSTACENGDMGINLQYSSGNEVNNNIANKSVAGIVLSSSNDNEIKNNTACENGDDGIHLEEDSSGNEVSNNIANNNLDGISLSRSNNNTIKNNTACENGDSGVNLQYSSGNEVNNNIANKNVIGIGLIGSNNNEIKNSTACENRYRGIHLEDSSGNEVSNNIANNNSDGIVLIRSNNNTIKNNTACENGDRGINLQYSSGNEVNNNIANKNVIGIGLIGSNNNEIKNSTACENRYRGFHLQNSSGNEVSNNIANNNSDGIVLLSSNSSIITDNNIVNNKIQAKIQNSYFNEFNHNYWSDYKGKDRNKDGFGDEPYVIIGIYQESDYDYCPYMNYSGWLNVVITPEFWYFFAKKGDVINKTFSIENRLNSLTEVEVLVDKNLSFELDGTSNKKFSIAPKSTINITLQLNTTNLEGYILRKIIFKTEEYTKTTLVNGFVQPKTHAVKIEGVDFHRNVVQGQINPSKVFIKNYGDRDKFRVTLRMGKEEKNSTVYLNETEKKTISFEIDTTNLPLGINKGEVVVSKNESLDYLNLTMFVASKLEASTLVVTNLSRFNFNESEELRSKLIDLTHHPAVNGILLDVKCNYSDDSNYSETNELCKEIKKQIEKKISKYPNIKYLIIAGDDYVIPFYRVSDGTYKVFTYKGLYDERHYYYKDYKPGVLSSIDDALLTNHFLTDDFYSNLTSGRVLAVGRLVETPEEIIKAIDWFFKYYQLKPTNVFVTGCHFMSDGSEECFELWHERINNTTFELNPDEIKSKILNSSISSIFLHADYHYFAIYEDKPLLKADEIKYLNGSIIYTMGCHAGLTIPHINDLAQSFLSNGTIVYIAPTGYGLGGVITVAGHEKLIEYFTKRIAEEEEVGFALMNAKNDYYLDNFNQDALDEKVLRSLTLYGFPMYAVRLNSATAAMSEDKGATPFIIQGDQKPSITAMNEDAGLEEYAMKELAYTASNITLEHATLTLRPTHKVCEIKNKTYYTSEGYTTEAGMPILPKATWYFIRGDKEFRGVALRSARFNVLEMKLAIETFAVSGTTGGEENYTGWYPPIPFTLNTIEDRQSIVTASAQYKIEGIIRLFNETVLDIFRVPVGAEREKPMVNVSIDKGTVTIKAEDTAGIYDIFITYLGPGNTTWESKTLDRRDRGKQSVEYSIELNNTAFFVQVVDMNGNVEIKDNKSQYYLIS